MVLPMPQPLRTKSGTYYFRQRVPADLTAAVGSRMVQFSLHTKDPKEAKERHAQELAKVQLRWKALRSKPEPLPHVQLVALAGELYRKQIALVEAEPGEPEIWVEVLRICERLDGDDRGMEQWYGLSADALLLDHGITTDDASRLRLIREAHSAYRQAAMHLLRQARGDYRPDPDADRFPKLRKGSRKATKGLAISELFDLWEREHLANGKSARTPRDHRQKVDDFVAFLGHDDANRVTREDVSLWTEGLRHERKLTAKTVADKYLSAVRAVFGAGVEKFRIENNPAAAVKVRVPKPKRERERGFTDDEALRILKAAVAAPNASGDTSGENRFAFRWVPWICAYTGARAGEIAQLRKEDFVREFGLPCIRITPEAGTVKTGEYRIVPLHPHLVDAGLLKVVEEAADGPLFYKPSGRTRKAGSSQASYLVGKVSGWVRSVAGVTDPRVQPNHGWRHRFKTVARDVGMDVHYLNVMQGHADGRAGTDYGETTVKALHREMRKLPRYKVSKT